MTETATLPETPSASRLVAARILVAEDSRLHARVARTALESQGHRVTVAPDGESALAALGEGPHDLLLTDWVMPGMSGVDLVRAVRAQADLSSLYVVFLTALGDTERVVEGLDAGADDYLAKPYESAELVARVSAGLRILALQRDLVAANQTLSQLAVTDPLTELPNRRAIERMLATTAAERARRPAVPACVGICDLDHFKSINDRHGHDVGDQVLREAARALRRSLRAEDSVGRLGGEEFALILRGFDLSDGATLCERLRETVGSVRVPTADGEVEVSASFGLAELRPGQEPLDALRASDAALYRAKAGGRNRVEIAPKESTVVDY